MIRPMHARRHAPVVVLRDGVLMVRLECSCHCGGRRRRRGRLWWIGRDPRRCATCALFVGHTRLTMAVLSGRQWVRSDDAATGLRRRLRKRRLQRPRRLALGCAWHALPTSVGRTATAHPVGRGRVVAGWGWPRGSFHCVPSGSACHSRRCCSGRRGRGRGGHSHRFVATATIRAISEARGARGHERRGGRGKLCPAAFAR
mmetsp:Transcript_12203/g.51399  ORF Transcript_12203/g.51399 Transcript_12203/m.51399 type:complete len:201 (+) Transcript_12203:718-1320(+)